MASWRDSILKEFTPRISRLTLVSDPDGLLTEEGMLSAIRERGFDLIPFDDPIAFRFAYESQYRSRWDSGQNTDLVVVLRSVEHRLAKVPFDLLKVGRQLSLAIHELFPKFNYPVIAALGREHLDAVHDAYQDFDGDPLGERATKDLVLTKCFGIVPSLIKKPVDLLKVLLSLHSRKVELPESLVQHLLECLATGTAFERWPLAEVLGSRESFLRFLQEEWESFVASPAGPSDDCLVPFRDEDVRAYIDTFFLDGSLKPVECQDAGQLPAWAQTGVLHDPMADRMSRFRGLWKRCEAEIPADDASHRLWQLVAQRWADLVLLRWELDESLDAEARKAWDRLRDSVEDAFTRWMMQRYGALHNLPYQQQPVMVHQISRFMAAERKRQGFDKVALLVLDGLAFDQWLLLKQSLEDVDKSWRFRESAAFAWVPTLTTVTRQSIFAGAPPLFFSDSLDTTSKEKAHWLRFWEDQGTQRSSIDLVTNLAGPDDPKLELALSNPRLSVLGIVWNQVDDIMHGMQLQTAGMHNQVRLWASQGHLQALLVRLHDEGFAVYLTADHGNVTATGIGNPREGVLVETRGKRVRVYDRTDFLEDVAGRVQDTVRWPNHGLPPGRYVLLADHLKAFTDVGSRVVSHGGIALEEVLVPFVAISREK